MFTAYQVSKYLKAMGFNVTHVEEESEHSGRVDLGDGNLRVQISNEYMFVEQRIGEELSDLHLYPQRTSLREIREDLEEITGGKKYV